MRNAHYSSYYNFKIKHRLYYNFYVVLGEKNIFNMIVLTRKFIKPETEM